MAMSEKDDYRAKLWTLAITEEAGEQKKYTGKNVLGATTRGIGKCVSFLLHAIAVFVTTAIGLCFAVCKLCFGFFFH